MFICPSVFVSLMRLSTKESVGNSNVDGSSYDMLHSLRYLEIETLITSTRNFFFAHPRLTPHLYYLRTFPFSLPRRNSDPGSRSRLFFPLPRTARAFVFITRILQPFLPSSTRIELDLPTRCKALLPLGHFLRSRICQSKMIFFGLGPNWAFLHSIFFRLSLPTGGSSRKTRSKKFCTFF